MTDKHFQRLFDQALAHLDSDNTAEALAILDELYKSHPFDDRVLRLFANTARRMDLVDLAIDLGIQLIRLYPDSEMDSVELFHSCYQACRLDLAFEELLRLTEHGDSPEYHRMLRSIISELSIEEASMSLNEFSKELLSRSRSSLARLERMTYAPGRATLSNLVQDTSASSGLDS